MILFKFHDHKITRNEIKEKMWIEIEKTEKTNFEQTEIYKP